MQTRLFGLRLERFTRMKLNHAADMTPGSLAEAVVGGSVPTSSRRFPVRLPARFAAAQPPMASAGICSESPSSDASASGSASGGSLPPRSVPAINSSGAALPFGMKPDFMPK